MSSLDRAHDPVLEERFAAYVDGQMTRAERRRFDRQLAAQPELAAALEVQTKVALSVRRRFVVPEFTTLFDRIDAAAAQMREGGRDTVEGSIRWLAAVATVLFLFLTIGVTSVFASGQTTEKGVVMSEAPGASDTVGIGLAVASAAVAVRSRVRKDRRGRWLVSRRGQDVALPSGATVVRAHRHSIVPGAMGLLVSRAGDFVTLIVADAARQPQLPARWADGRRVFRRETNGLVLFEIAASAVPQVADDCVVAPRRTRRAAVQLVG